MTFRLLGPLEIYTAGMTVRLGGPRQRAVLAALLLRANTIASIGYLIRAVWENPPAAPESNLRTYVAGLRQMLREAGDGGARLSTQPNGYSLAVGPGELDAARFEELATQGRLAVRGSDFVAAAECFRTALSLWRGQPLEGEALGPVLHAEVARLQERRFAVVGRYSEVCLEVGQLSDLVLELRWLVSEHPLREELCAQLMLALYRCGRQAEALEVFQQARERLVRELGIEPGPRLQSVHQEILTSSRAFPETGQRYQDPASKQPVPNSGASHG
jgi:DNA-binding SARP family transcriptional activator